MADPASIQYSKAYQDLRSRVGDVVRDVDQARFDGPSPATPDWRVHDVLSHLVGVTDDVVNGRLEGVATNAWTAAQVAPRVDCTVDELLAEWEQHSPGFEAALDAAPPEVIGQAMFDAVTHEHDIRCALGAPGARESDALLVAWDWYLGARTRSNLPLIAFVTEAGHEVSGVGDPVATVEASRFELLRAAVGRRSASEIAQYGWDAEPDAELLLAAPMFRLRAEPLGE
jgi:uncharacterized protein (TIGR03083 family)